MIEELKSVMYTLSMSSDECDMLIEGSMEVGTLRFIRESKISGFVWIDELARYIHISENPQHMMRK